MLSKLSAYRMVRYATRFFRCAVHSLIDDLVPVGLDFVSFDILESIFTEDQSPSDIDIGFLVANLTHADIRIYEFCSSVDFKIVDSTRTVL
jgi:hypothetical protein